MTRATPQRARKLSDDDVREIRQNPIPAIVLAKHYGVSDTVIYDIRNRVTYQHVRDEQ
jgi:hypothetical protein